MHFIYPASIVRNSWIHLSVGKTGKPDHLVIHIATADKLKPQKTVAR